jgi:hypothetical protein
MVRKTRISIARLMGVVLIAAIGFGALRNSSEAWAGVMLLLTCGAILLAVAGALGRGPGERAWWLGFVLFGGGYLALAHAMASAPSTLPTITLAEAIGLQLGAPLVSSTRGGGGGWSSLAPSCRIVHCMWALALAVLGCVLAGVIVTNLDVGGAARADEPRTDRPPSWTSWKRAGPIGLAGFFALAMAAAVGRLPAPGVWAGASFLLACGLLGMAALGAAFSRGRGREAWLGAALFGFGYLALSFGKSDLFIVTPHPPTEAMINSLLRPGGPPVQSGFPDFTTPGYYRVRDEVIRRKLDQPIRFHFPEETPLADVLKYIRDATTDTNFHGIPMYVDPMGLQNAEKSLNSPVQIDFDAIPVRDGLSLCLKQLGLGYTVRSGFLMITDPDQATIPVYEDPVQVVGHSLLALIAAGVGAVAAPFFSDRARRARRTDRAIP